MRELDELKRKNYDKYIINDPDFVNKQSSASAYVEDIKGIMFGGLHSRFWMLRKHFNSVSK